MIKLLLIILFFNITSFSDLYFFGKEINSLVEKEVSFDYFLIPYTLLTGKGDCYNVARLFNFGLNLRGVSNEILFVDSSGDGLLDHTVVRVNDSSFGCYIIDVVNSEFNECVGGDSVWVR